MGKKLSDEEVAELLQGDISDLEELDEGDDINIDNLNEILNQFPDNIDELYPMQNNLLEEDEVNFENNLIILKQRDIELEIEEENRLFDEQVRIDRNWEKVPYQNPDSTWKGNLPDPPTHILSLYEYFKQYFDDDIIQNLCEQTNIYSVQKSGKCIAISSAEIEQFIGIQMYVFMDNWFNSYNLQCKLKFVGGQSIGTVCSNCIAAFVLENDKQLKSRERFQFDSRVDTNNNIVVTKWHDNEVVHVISNLQRTTACGECQKMVDHYVMYHQVKKVELLLQDQLTLSDLMKLDIGQSES
ncbi:hypothetical protein QTP88_023502 [Uroleucon formosanum]